MIVITLNDELSSTVNISNLNLAGLELNSPYNKSEAFIYLTFSNVNAPSSQLWYKDKEVAKEDYKRLQDAMVG